MCAWHARWRIWVCHQLLHIYCQMAKPEPLALDVKVTEDGPPHSKIFTVDCIVDGVCACVCLYVCVCVCVCARARVVVSLPLSGFALVWCLYVHLWLPLAVYCLVDRGWSVLHRKILLAIISRSCINTSINPFFLSFYRFSLNIPYVHRCRGIM